jgi:hypothetical protein
VARGKDSSPLVLQSGRTGPIFPVTGPKLSGFYFETWLPSDLSVYCYEGLLRKGEGKQLESHMAQ